MTKYLFLCATAQIDALIQPTQVAETNFGTAIELEIDDTGAITAADVAKLTFGKTSADDVKPTEKQFEDLRRKCNYDDNGRIAFNSEARVACCIQTCIQKCDYVGTTPGRDQWKCWDAAPDSPAYKMTVVQQGSGLHDCTQSCLCFTKFTDVAPHTTVAYEKSVVPYEAYTEKQLTEQKFAAPTVFDVEVDICLAFQHSDAFRKQIEDLIQFKQARLPFNEELMKQRVRELTVYNTATEEDNVNYLLKNYFNEQKDNLGMKPESYYNCVGMWKMCDVMADFKKRITEGRAGSSWSDMTYYWNKMENEDKEDPYCKEELVNILKTQCLN